MRTIRVTGKGKIKVKPDMTRLTITLEGLEKEYAETLERSSKDTGKLKAALEKFGFDRSDVKTLSFSVDAEYRSYKKNETYYSKLVGYRFSHRLKVEFVSDNVRLGKIVYALARSEVRPEFKISYTVKDPEAAKNELLGKAVADSKAKAHVLTDAAGVALKDIQNIDYSWGEINFEISPMRDLVCEKMMLSDCSADAGYDYDIEPDDIEVTDTVTVVWEIE